MQTCVMSHECTKINEKKEKNSLKNEPKIEHCDKKKDLFIKIPVIFFL